MLRLSFGTRTHPHCRPHSLSTMQHYSEDQHYEREPLDPAYDNRYDTPPRRATGAGRANHDQYADQEAASPYYDDSPHRRAEPYTPHFEQSRYDNLPAVQDAPPPPPPHGDIGLHSHADSNSPSPYRSDDAYRSPAPNTTPGADNSSPVAAGGMAGVAHNVADGSPREGGYDGRLRSTGQVLPPPSHGRYPRASRSNNSPRHSVHSASHSLAHSGPYAGGYAIDRDSRSSVNPFGTVTSSSIGSRSPSRSPHVPADPYGSTEQAYYNYSNSRPDVTLGVVDPMSIEDDGDDGLNYGRRSHRNSGNGSSSRRGAAAAGAIGAAAGGSTAVMTEHGT